MADFSAIGTSLDTGLQSGDSVTSPQSADSDPDYAHLKSMYQSELSSPTLLPYPAPLVPDYVLLLSHQGNVISNKTSTGPISTMMNNILSTELTRIRYIITDYLRIRIRKIESNPWYYISMYPDGVEDGTVFMSEQEVAFCRRYIEMVTNVCKAGALDGLPEGVPGIMRMDADNMISSDAGNEYVLGKMRVDGDGGNGGVGGEKAQREWDDEDFRDVRKGNMIMGRWEKVRGRVERGEMELL